MTKLVPLNKSLHANLKVRADLIDSIGAEENLVPVVVSEFLKLSVHYPIVLTRNSETNQFVPVVILGFKEKENLFWQGKRWDAIYVPLNITRQPFFIGASASENHKYTVCVDMESPCVSENQGQAIFTESGEDTALFINAKKQLAELIEGEIQTQDFIKTLAEMNLFTSLSLELNFNNGEKEKIHSIYSIDEKVLRSLRDDDILHLHRKNFLKPMYIMMSSISQIYTMVERKNKRLLN